jgi:integrase/recombinase XerD
MLKTYLESVDVEQMEEAAINLRDNLLIHLFFHLGCRISEALGLTVNDLDLVNNTVNIQHLKLRLHLTCSQCGARMSQSHTYCPRCGFKVDQAVAKAKDGTQYIFGINRHRAWQIIGECAHRAGLPELINPETGRRHAVSPHRLRDSFAVHAMKMDDSGEGMRMLQEHLGHASFNTTAKYRKVTGDELKTWYTKLWKQKN